MSNSFTNWLTNARSFDPKLGGVPVFKDYQHATRLYVDNNYLKSPKVGFLYYILFNINPNSIVDPSWGFKNSKDVGLLVKKVDLPKFKISTETLNQYNRKTVVQTKLNYEPVSIEFHDDNQDITNNLWINYYQYYFKDSNYGGSSVGEATRNEQVPQFKDTKFNENSYVYGRYNRNNNLEPFFTSIDIYVLHQGFFTQFTLVNPKITDWSHDSLNQSENAKILQNKMTLMYENVFYNQGQILNENNPEGFSVAYYDKTPSPLGVIGINDNQTLNRQQSEFDKPGKNKVFGSSSNGNLRPRDPLFDKRGKPRTYGLVGAPGSLNPIADIALILLKNKLNKTGLGRMGPVGYNIANSAYAALSNTSSGKYSDPPPTQNQPGIINLPGGVGINIFKGLNKGVDGKIRVNPAAIILPKK